MNLISPSLVSFELIKELLSLTLTVSGLSVATASFVTGLYISKLKTLTPKEKTQPFVYLIVSLIVLPIVICVVNGIAIVVSVAPCLLKAYVFLINLAPIAPIAAILYILVKKGAG